MPMKSMTGYGKSVYEGKDYYIEVELKSVNSRFLEIRTSIPRELSFLEIDINNMIKKRISRGKISVKISFLSYLPPVLKINENKLNTYHKLYKNIKKTINSQDDIPLSLFLENDEIIIQNTDESGNADLKERIFSTLTACIDNHSESAYFEGASMFDFLNRSKETIKEALKIIEGHYPSYKEKISGKLLEAAEKVYSEKLTDEDMNRISLELVLYLEKADINEEIVRLQHHTDKFSATLHQEGEKGKTLNFILQEMHREINTIGAKFNENEIFDQIIQIKEEIEKCREMVQNVV